MWSLQTPIPCNGWSLLEYPHLRLQVPLAHTLLQCKIHCEEIKKKKDRWKTCGQRVICRKSHAMHLSRKSNINDEWCAASEQGRNASRPDSNGTAGGNQVLLCNHLLYKWGHIFCTCCFSLTTAVEFTLWPTAETLQSQLQCIFWKPDYFPALLAWLRRADAPLPNCPPRAPVFPSPCHYPLARATQF